MTDPTNRKQAVINREDLLELTRRMTLKRNCFSRAAGAYLDEEGWIDGTFHTHFLKLSSAEQSKLLKIAKAIPFAETNVKLRLHYFDQSCQGKDSIWQLLLALLSAELKNDALLEVFYELVGEHYPVGQAYGVYFFFGTYDVPRKASDHENQWESEEVYPFMICAFCPVHDDYEPEEPDCGFLFPAFMDRSGDLNAAAVFDSSGSGKYDEIICEILGLK